MSPGREPTAVRDGGEVTALVLAGGGATRFGSDKLAAPLHGSTVLGHLLSSLPSDWPVVVVGPARATTRPVRWAREDPPGGGPLAAVAAGMTLVDTSLVAVVAGDMPHAGPALTRLLDDLRAAGPAHDAAITVDVAGRPNPLLAVYRSEALRAALPRPAHGGRASTLLAVPHVETLVVGSAARDVDTISDLARESGEPGP